MNPKKFKISIINKIKKKIPPVAINKKEGKVSFKRKTLEIQKIKTKNNIIQTKITNIQGDSKIDSQHKIIHNSFLINKTFSRWTSLNYNLSFSKFLHIMDQTYYK